MTPGEHLALRHLIELCLSSTTTEEVIHRERLRQAKAAIEAERAAEQKERDYHTEYVKAFDARSRRLAELARANVEADGTITYGADDTEHLLSTEANRRRLMRSVGGN